MTCNGELIDLDLVHHFPVFAPCIYSGLFFGLLAAVYAGASQAAGPSSFSQSNQFVAYPGPPGEARSQSYSLTVNGQPVFVTKFKDISYAHFAFSGTAEVVVRAGASIVNFSISPKSRGIQAVKSGSDLSFALRQPEKLIVTIDKLEKLFIFADPPEVDPPRPGQAGVIDIRDYGVDQTGATVDTAKIQKAIDVTASQNGGTGGVLYFPAGKYLTGTIEMRSNVTVYLAPGALLQGSSNPADYPVDPGFSESGINGETMTFSRLIYFDHVVKARIIGRGTIDGNGKTVRRAGRAANLIRMKQSSDIAIEDVVLRDSAAWNLHPLYCDNVAIRNIKMMNDLTNPNTDGVDPDSSHHVTIDGCFFYCSDDCIANKTTNNSNLLRDCEDITVSNCVFWTIKTAQKIGTETKGRYMRRIRFENNDVVHADRAYYLTIQDGAIAEDNSCDNIRTEVIGGDSQQRIFLMEIKKRSGSGLIRGITFTNWSSEDFSPNNSALLGLDSEHQISNVAFVNLVIAGQKRAGLNEARICANNYVNNVTFK